MGTRQIAQDAPPPKIRRRLFLDIETSPNIGTFWRPGRKVSIDYENITQERAMLCATWAWEHEGGRLRSETCDLKALADKKLVSILCEVLEEADEVVAHNGDRFDLRWIRARALFHRIPLTPHLVTVDTCKLARKYFDLNSNRLDYIGKYLGFGGKRDTGGFGLWKAVVIDRNPLALKEMVRYNRRDVKLLMDVHEVLSLYAPAKTSIANDRKHCPHCGQYDPRIVKIRASAANRHTLHLQCGACERYYALPLRARKRP